MRILTIIPVVLFAASSAYAQEEGPAGADSGAKPVVPEAKADEPEEYGTGRFTTGADESVYIVQRRSYSKKGNFELTPLGFTALNPKFVGYRGVAASIAYHVRENLSLEVLSSVFTDAYYSDLVHDVYEFEQLTPEEVDLKQMTYFAALSLQFSALYGKLEFYGFLMDYDFYVTTGVGLATTVEPCQPNRGDCSDDEERIGRGLHAPEDSSDRRKVTGNLGGGMRVFFSEHFGLRLEVRDIVYSDRKVEQSQTQNVGATTTDIRNNLMLLLGVTFMI